MKDNLRQLIINEVKTKLQCSAHDLRHVFRVYNMCKYLAQFEESIDCDILDAAALLHDIARVEEDNDNTGKSDHAVLGAAYSFEILQRIGFDEEFSKRVSDCILTHRYRAGRIPQSKEAEILFDADKLDVIGAIGICRSYMLSGEYGQDVYYNGDIPQYISSNLVGGVKNGRIIEITKHSPNLEYELKLKSIPKQLHSTKAREIAEERMKIMDLFFAELKKEISYGE